MRRTEQTGIVFLDEIDKVAGERGHAGPDVSREGVQRDLLPIVEGSTVSTKHGPVRTDHMLFIAAGAFHVVEGLRPDPGAAGPLPDPRRARGADARRLRAHPDRAEERADAPVRRADARPRASSSSSRRARSTRIAEYAEEANRRSENIGARRLHTIMEALLEELSFTAPERSEPRVRIDAADVRSVLAPLLANEDLARFIL